MYNLELESSYNHFEWYQDLIPSEVLHLVPMSIEKEGACEFLRSWGLYRQ